jgi:hypothetical protein
MGIVAFYVVAHQDDWQLFRGQQAWSDIQSGAQIVFIYLTAGDAGGDRGVGWWEAREVAALESCRLVTGAAPLLRKVWWVGYDIQNRILNLTPLEVERKRNLQKAYTDRILRETTEAGAPEDDWAGSQAIYEGWLDKSYERVQLV